MGVMLALCYHMQKILKIYSRFTRDTEKTAVYRHRCFAGNVISFLLKLVSTVVHKYHGKMYSYDILLTDFLRQIAYFTID